MTTATPASTSGSASTKISPRWESRVTLRSSSATWCSSNSASGGQAAGWQRFRRGGVGQGSFGHLLPLSGDVTEVNDSLLDAPEKINADPHGDGWLVRNDDLRPQRDPSAPERRAVRSVCRGGNGRIGEGPRLRYLPKSPVEREAMLADLGARSAEELFESNPRAPAPEGAAEHS